MSTFVGVALVCVLALAALSPAAAAGVQCGRLRLDFDAAGNWSGLHLGNRQVLAGGQPDLEIGGESPLDEKTPLRLVSVDTRQDAGRWVVTVHREGGDWQVTERYLVTAAALRRHAWFRWQGKQAVKVTGSRLRLPGLTLAADPAAFYQLPGNWPVERHRFADNAPGRAVGESGRVWADTTLAVAHAPGRRLGVAAGYQLTGESARLEVEEGEGAISIVHRFATLCRLQPGQAADCGEQVLRLSTGGYAATLETLGRLSDDLGNGPPADRPAWTRAAAIYSCYPGGPIDGGFAGLGGFAHLEARLPELAGLGFTALWLNPLHTKPPWIYGIEDYRAVAPEIGTADDARRFVAAAHRQGLKVMLDLVPHGPNRDTPAAKEAPAESWTRGEDGELVTAWGGLAGDHASKAWQQYMADIAAYWVGGFGVDGFRVDCAAGNAPNWGRGDGRRPSLSAPWGGQELLDVVRRRMRGLNPDAALFPETWAPMWFRHGDFVYDYSFYNMARQLTTGLPVAEWVRNARAWLQLERLTVPAAARGGLVRFVENHDTARSAQFFGLGPAQALTALCVLAQGTPLIYQDQEIGCSENLARWLHLRRALPELHGGEADYQAVACSEPAVLAFLRTAEDGAAVVAISFLPHEAEVTLKWPAALAAKLPWQQVVGSGKPARSGKTVVRLPAYGVAVVMLRSTVATTPAGEQIIGTVTNFHDQIAKSPARDEPDLATEQPVETRPLGPNTEYRLPIGQASWWCITGSEGMAQDRFLDRHTINPSPRYGYLWHPLANALWDGGPGEIAVLDAAGRLVRVTVPDPGQLVDARLEDPSQVGHEVSIVLVAKGTEQPFRVKVTGRGALPRAPEAEATAWSRRVPLSPRERAGVRGSSTPPAVTLDALHATVNTGHLRATFLRRHGGLLGALAVRDGGHWRPLPLGDANLYSDWGLWQRGQPISAGMETSPRVAVEPDGKAVEITFTGHLRLPSWNGVASGGIASPPADYALAYRATGDRLRVRFSLTPATDRPGTKAFYAYHLPFGRVTEWWAQTATGRLVTKGPDFGHERVFQTAETPLAAGRPELGLVSGGVRLTLRVGEGMQNAFLHGGGDGRLSLFLAGLNGQSADLPAGRTVTWEVELRAAPL